MYSVCGKYNIFLQGYASLGGGTNNNNLLSEKAVKDIAKRHEVTPAQILLRWSLQSGYRKYFFIILFFKLVYLVFN